MKTSFLRRLLGQASNQVALTINPWSGSDGTYIKDYRSILDEIAAKLSVEGRIVSIRFNKVRMCAEVTADHEVIAEIRVFGSECSPYQTLVSAFTIDSSALGFFEDERLPKVRFGPVPLWINQQAA